MAMSYYSLTKDNDTFPRHMHNSYEILFCLRGDVEFTLGSSVYRLSSGYFLMIPPCVFHSALRVSDAFYERVVIHFNKEEIPECACGAVEKPIVLSLPEDHFFTSIFRYFSRCQMQYAEKELDLLKCSTLNILLLQLHFLNDGQVIEPIHNNPLMNRILSYINSHPCEAHGTESLAARFYVSQSWISHNFRTLLGISVTQYVRKNRILYAQTRIRAGENAADVARKCGYDSYTTFFRQYKQVIGHSPREEKTGAIRD